MGPRAMDIDELGVYKRAMRLAEEIWTDVEDWPSFAKYSVGTQITQAAELVEIRKMLNSYINSIGRQNDS